MKTASEHGPYNRGITSDKVCGAVWRVAATSALLLWFSLTDFAAAGTPPYLNATDYPTIQSAVDALGAKGGTVWIPPGTYDSTTTPAYLPPLVLPRSASVRILGAGQGATILSSHNPTKDLCLIRGSYQTIEQLTFSGAAAFGLAGKGRGIVVGTTSGVIAHSTVRQTVIQHTPSWGIQIQSFANPSDSLVILCTYDGVSVSSCADSGAVSIDRACTTQYFRDCSFTHFAGYGARVRGSGHQFLNCDFEQGPDGPPSKEFLFLEACGGVDIRNCWFEDQRPEASPPYFLRTHAPTWHVTVDGCTFLRRTARQVRALWIDPWMHSLVVVNPAFSARDTVGEPFDARHQITVRGYSGALTDDKRVTATIIGGVTGTQLAYYPLAVTDSLRAGEKPQPGVTLMNR